MATTPRVAKRVRPEDLKMASQRAVDRARAAKWDLNIAILLFAVLITVVILSFQNIGLEIVAPVAAFGLALVWFVGWVRGRRLYNRFYKEETDKELAKITVDEQLEESIEMIVKKNLLKRLK